MDPNQYSNDQQQYLLANEEKQNESDYDKDFAKRGRLLFCNLVKRNRARTAPTSTDALDQLQKDYGFPTYKDGKLVEDHKLEDFKEVEWQSHKVRYKDFKLGKGKAVKKMRGEEKPSQKVTLNYNFCDISSGRVGKNIKHEPPYERSPKKVKLCHHLFGKGFEKGIEGMRRGGIRRIIVPHELTSKHKNFKVEGDAIYDVELHKVGLSLACVVKGIIGDKNEDDITWTSVSVPQPK